MKRELTESGIDGPLYSLAQDDAASGQGGRYCGGNPLQSGVAGGRSGHATGRELRPDEMSAILKQHGHPVIVASRYRDPSARGLISPALFPLYWFTLRAIFGVWVTVRVIIAVFVLQGTATAGWCCHGLGATFCWRRSSLAGASLCFSPSGNIWSSNSAIRSDGNRSPWPLFRPPSGHRNRSRRFRLSVEWCG